MWLREPKMMRLVWDMLVDVWRQVGVQSVTQKSHQDQIEELRIIKV